MKMNRGDIFYRLIKPSSMFSILFVTADTMYYGLKFLNELTVIVIQTKM